LETSPRQPVTPHTRPAQHPRGNRNGQEITCNTEEITCNAEQITCNTEEIIDNAAGLTDTNRPVKCTGPQFHVLREEYRCKPRQGNIYLNRQPPGSQKPRRPCESLVWAA